METGKKERTKYEEEAIETGKKKKGIRRGGNGNREKIKKRKNTTKRENERE